MGSKPIDLKMDAWNMPAAENSIVPEIILGQYLKIEITAQENDKKEKEDEIIQTLIKNAQIKVPELMIEKVAFQMAEEFAKRLSQQGLSMEQYYSCCGLSAKLLLEQMMPVAEKRVKGRLVLEAIAAAEHLDVTEEEYDREITRLSSRYPLEKDEIKKLVAGKEEIQIKTDLVIQKALELVWESTVPPSISLRNTKDYNITFKASHYDF